MSTLVGLDAIDGVRLLSPRPSVLFKIEHLGQEGSDGDGVVIFGPDWDERLRDALDALSHTERTCLYAVRIHERDGIPLPALTLLHRARTDWFPKFLSSGQLVPVFQPIVDLRTATVYGREALIRGRMGRTELRGDELFEAAEAHDTLYSFDSRARSASLEAGLPALPDGEILFVNLDPRGLVDVETAMRGIWPLVERMESSPDRVGIEIVQAERPPDRGLLEAVVAAHRERGATITLDRLAGGGNVLNALESLRPHLAKLDIGLMKGIEESGARRRLVGSLVEVAHELGCRVVAVGIERDTQLEAVIELDVDFAQGFLLGQPTEEILPVDTRLISAQSR